MLGDSLLYSRDITRVSPQGGMPGSGWVSDVLPPPARPLQLGFGPARIVVVQCPIYTSTPGTTNPWGIWVGTSNHQTRYIGPGQTSNPPFLTDRLENLWVIRETDYSGGGDITTKLTVGFDYCYDPPYAQFEPEGTQNLRLFSSFLDTKDLWKELISRAARWFTT